MNLLLVEDDAVLGQAVQKGLSDAGHVCEWIRDGAKALVAARSHRYDVILLDLMLPELSGLDVLASLRAEGNATPIVVLTAKGSVEDRVAGLNQGADDYLVKPFALVELLARLDAVVRRSTARPSTESVAGPLRLDLTNRKATRSGKEVSLTPTEFSLLELLMRYAGQVVTRKMLCEHLWEADWEGVTNVIEVHINRLRSKVDRGFDPALIHTVRGRGYILKVT